MLFLEMFIREEDLIFPLRTKKFLRAGLMVVVSLFRKEKVDFSLQLQNSSMEITVVFCFISHNRTTKI